jgi:hypothetical protein
MSLLTGLIGFSTGYCGHRLANHYGKHGLSDISGVSKRTGRRFSSIA